MSETTVSPSATAVDQIRTYVDAIRIRMEVSEAERAFRLYYVERTLPMARSALIFGIALVVSVCILDWYLLPREFVVSAIPFRIVSMILPLAFVVAASYVDTARTVLPFLITTASVLVGVSTIAVGGMAAKHGIQFVLWGMIFTTFYVYLVLGLRMRLSAIAGIPILLTYVVIGMITGAPVTNLAYGTLFLSFSNVAGMYASYLLEKNAREIFVQNGELGRLAQTDGLTGVYNRRTFDSHLENVWRQARRDNCAIAVLLVDIDFFKLFNDCYGHQEGDSCIRSVADVLSTSLNRPLDMVARYGGEEFAIILYDPNAEFVERFGSDLCERIYALEIPHKGSDCAAVVTVSVGAALVFPREGNSSEQMIRSADDALYEAKDRDRNQAIVYQSQWSEPTSARLPAIAL